MSCIRILSDQVANQIAAGEVVERPSSVMKELVENALDAGAGAIEIHWEDGGKRLLEISDNGSGMTRDDLYLALERHATSKVRTADDLVHLDSYGFRGEALPSIASVTRFELHSATSDGAGHRLRSEFGVIKGVQPAPRARGTTVTVRDLFAQLPARKRFLKSTETEHSHLWSVATRLALATPAVRWTICTDKSSAMILPVVEDAGERLAPLLGEKFAQLLPFSEWGDLCRLHGYVSSPNLSFRDRNHFYLFVNGRSVRDRLLLAALSEAWQGFFPKGAYPAAVIFLEIAPESVDVNVHPTKAEVRFREPHRIFPWVTRVLKATWGAAQNELPDLLSLPPKPQEADLEPSLKSGTRLHPRLWEEESDLTVASYVFPQTASKAAETPAERAKTESRPAEAKAAPASERPAFRYLGAFDATYLLAEVQGEAGPELWMVDQHVAHERILFEAHYHRKHNPAIQALLPPQVLQLGRAAISQLSPWMEEFIGVGIDCEIFGDDSLVVRGLPDFLADRDPENLLEALLHRLEAGGKADLDAFRRELNGELACRAAIKKNQILDPSLAEQLIRDLMACEVSLTCPHGRPIIKKLTRTELERSFGRRV